MCLTAPCTKPTHYHYCPCILSSPRYLFSRMGSWTSAGKLSLTKKAADASDSRVFQCRSCPLSLDVTLSPSRAVLLLIFSSRGHRLPHRQEPFRLGRHHRMLSIIAHRQLCLGNSITLKSPLYRSAFYKS